MPAEATKPLCRGEIDLLIGDEVLRAPNMIVEQSTEILAQAIASGKSVNGMIFLYDNAVVGNESELVIPAKSASLTAASLRAGPYSNGSKGILRSFALAEPVISAASNGKQSRTSFFAAAAGTAAVPLAGNTYTPGVSRIYGAALAYLDPLDMSKDKIYSIVNFEDNLPFRAVLVVAGRSVAINWHISILP